MHPKTVKYPFMRLQIVNYIEKLSDPLYQKEVWLLNKHSEYKEGLWNALDYLFDTAYLEEDLENDNRSSIGVVFCTEEEALAISQVIRALNQVLEDSTLGKYPKDEAYLNSQFWPMVVKTASIAKNVFEKTQLED
jgi:hypothetical protein